MRNDLLFIGVLLYPKKTTKTSKTGQSLLKATGLVLLIMTALGSRVFAQTYTAATLTGFNYDIVANGVGAASISTNNDLGSSRALVAADFRASSGGTAPTYALPANGLISSAATTGLSFQLAAYSGNNALRFDTQNQTGTLTFATPKAATDVYLLATAGEYDATVDVVVNFSDATSQTFTGVVIKDWYDGTTTNRTTSGIGRINTTNSGLEGDATNPHLYELPLSIATGNRSKLINSIRITKTDPTVLVYPAVGGGIAAILAVTTGFTVTPSYTTVAVTGFNYDIIANGTGAASASTNNDLGSTRALVAADFRAGAGGTAPTYALPANGLISSAVTSGLSFQLAAYTGNNALRFDTQNQTGMLAFATPKAATDVYLLATAGEYDATIDVVVNFSDATSQTFTGVVIKDWYDGTTTNRVTSGIGRINTTNSALEGDATNPHLYQLPLAIATANTGKLISSIRITKTDPTVLVYPAVGGGIAAILGVSINASTALPVRISAFYGKKSAGANQLFWTTATEINNSGFELERSRDGIQFTSIQSIVSKATNGNSALPLNYVVTDQEGFVRNSYYRLKQTDKDGKLSYSTVVLLKASTHFLMSLESIYPNPVSSFIHTNLVAEVSGRVTVSITDIRGTVVFTRSLPVNTGANTIRLEPGKLAAGNYYLKAIAGNGVSNTVPFVVQ